MVSKAKHPVIRLIDALSGAKDILCAAYDAVDDIDVDVDTNNRLAQLFEYQLLKRSSDEHIYLDSSFRRLLDKAFRVDTLSYLSSDISEELIFFNQEFEQYRAAVTNADLITSESKLVALKRRCRAISDSLIDNSKELEYRATYHYGQTIYGPDRIKENNYYLEQLERLRDSYSQVVKFFNEGDFSNYFEVQDCITNFRARAFDFLSRVDDTIKFLKDFQYQTRQHHHRTNKLKALANHLKSNPGDEHSIARVAAYEIDYCSIAKPVTIKTYPDTENVLFEAKYSAIIQSIRNRQLARENAYHRTSSGNTIISSETIELETPSAEMFFTKILKEILKTRKQVSAVEFYIQNSPSNLSLAFWLFHLISYVNDRTYIDTYRLDWLIKWDFKVKYDSQLNSNGTVIDCLLAPKVSNSDK